MYSNVKSECLLALVASVEKVVSKLATLDLAAQNSCRHLQMIRRQEDVGGWFEPEAQIIFALSLGQISSDLFL